MSTLKIPIIIIFCFSTLVLTLNAIIYQYPGNNYLYFNTIPVWIFAFFNFALLLRMLGVHVITKKIMQEYLLFFLVSAMIVFGANAIQYTPFTPIDAHILAWEKKLHLDSLSMVIWTNRHPKTNLYLNLMYNILEFEMIFCPIYALTLKKYHHLHEYFFLMLTTVYIGFIFYYFFPTTGPASNLPASYFTQNQLATGLKFSQIHHYQQPTTLLGGMIAMPSFHVIWAWLNVYLIRFKPLLCGLFVILNLFLTCACVLLGWHYVLDIVGSVLLLAMTFYIYKKSVPLHPEALLSEKNIS